MTEEKTMSVLRLSSGEYTEECLKKLPLDRLKVIRRKLTFKLASLTTELEMINIEKDECGYYKDKARYERVHFAHQISKAWLLRLNEWIAQKGNEYQMFHYWASRILDSDTFNKIQSATTNRIGCPMSPPVFPEDLE